MQNNQNIKDHKQKQKLYCIIKRKYSDKLNKMFKKLILIKKQVYSQAMLRLIVDPVWKIVKAANYTLTYSY